MFLTYSPFEGVCGGFWILSANEGDKNDPLRVFWTWLGANIELKDDLLYFIALLNFLALSLISLLFWAASCSTLSRSSLSLFSFKYSR